MINFSFHDVKFLKRKDKETKDKEQRIKKKVYVHKKYLFSSINRMLH